MAKRTSMSGRLVLAAMALAGLTVCAEETALEPMAGTGGVMRDAERRALGGVPEKDAKKVADVLPGQKADEAPRPGDDKPLGEIAAVKVFGSTAFAEDTGLADRLLAELKGEGAKTAGDVSKAIAKVRQDLMKDGYYLLRVSPARDKMYDAKTKTLSVLVDQGSFGKLSAKFGEKDEGSWFSSQQIYRRFKGIEEGRPFDYTLLRSALFDANSHPDLVIDTSIAVRKPIEGEGNDKRIARYADVNFDVHESFPLHAVLEVNNFGMEEINEWQASLTAQYLNLTKRDDVLTVSPAMSLGGEMFSLAASYLLPHDWWLGGNTTLYGGWSDLGAEDIVPELDLDGSGYFVGLQHSENLYNTDRHQLALSAGLLWRYIEDQYTAMGYKLNERGVTILPATLALSYTGKKADFLGGRNFATVQTVYNIMSGGDGLDELWTGSEENYMIFRCQLARLQPVFGWFDAKTQQDLHQWILFLKVEGQYSSDTLVPVEKLSLGGYNCLRGYRARGILGDYGVYGTVELRSPILVDTFASLFGDRTDKKPIDRLQFLAFFDYGVANYNDLPDSYEENDFLCSYGVGARLALTKYSQLRCDVAFPIEDSSASGEKENDCEFYLGMQVQF